MNAVLISTYELGHQPYGLAAPAAWLRDAGFKVRCFDLAVSSLDHDAIREAGVVGFHLPMHTATRLAVPVIRTVRETNPDASLCAYGLYAPMNAELLRRLGVDAVIGGEFEGELVRFAQNANGESANGPLEHNSSGSVVIREKIPYRVPDRSGLPGPGRYAYLTMPDGSRRVAGYTEASRGCKHLCRHCPVVPVYRGRFFAVPRDLVLDDIAQQVWAGAEHITFGDPDFFNGPGHALRIVRALHERWPQLTYDVTVKVEHLVRHARHLSSLKSTGCLFIISAVESIDDAILGRLAKGHTRDDFVRALDACRQAGIDLQPTFVSFTPWISLEDYEALLQAIASLGLGASVAPVQLAIRLLIPEGSRLLELPDVKSVIGTFDESALCYPWRHSDFRVDELQREIEAFVGHAGDTPRAGQFRTIWTLTQQALGRNEPVPHDPSFGTAMLPPALSEPWYCCAEPNPLQRQDGCG